MTASKEPPAQTLEERMAPHLAAYKAAKARDPDPFEKDPLDHSKYGAYAFAEAYLEAIESPRNEKTDAHQPHERTPPRTPQRIVDRERMRVRALGRALHRASGQIDLDIHRAEGGCVCDECGFAYDDHPNFDPACPTLVVLCDGTYVKL